MLAVPAVEKKLLGNLPNSTASLDETILAAPFKNF